MTPEGRVKEKVKKILKAYDYRIYSHWPVLNGMGAPTLDCIGCIDGQFFAIETKAEKGVLTPRQALTIRQMEAAGAKVFVITGTSKEAFEHLESWIEGRLAFAHVQSLLTGVEP